MRQIRWGPGAEPPAPTVGIDGLYVSSTPWSRRRRTWRLEHPCRQGKARQKDPGSALVGRVEDNVVHSHSRKFSKEGGYKVAPILRSLAR